MIPSSAVKQASAAVASNLLEKLKHATPDPTPQTGRDHLLWMCRSIIENAPNWPLDKTSRWLGYIQGIMTIKGLISMEEERSSTRSLFHAAYKAEGVTPPASLGRETKKD